MKLPDSITRQSEPRAEASQMSRMSHLSHLAHISGLNANPGNEPDVSDVPNVTDVQVLPFGSHECAEGIFNVDAAGLSAMVADFLSRKNEMVVDYEHQSLSGAEAPAAGWITELLDRGAEGLWARVRWTARALGYLKNREYRYLSPVFLTENSTGRAVRLINIALTNQPAIDGMAPVVAKRALNQEEVNAMDGTDGTNVIEEIFRALGLGASATAAEAISEIKALVSERDALRSAKDSSALPAELMAALGLSEGASLSEAIGMAEALRRAQSEAAGLVEKLEQSAARLRAIEAETLVESAIKDGKVTPAQRDWARQYAGRDPEGFTAFAAKAPVVVRHSAMQRPAERAAPAIDELQAEVNRITGVSNALYIKHHARRLGGKG